MKVVLQQESGAELERSHHHHNLRKLYQNMPDRVRRYCEERWSNEHGDADLAQLLFDGDAITELRYLTGGRRPSSTVRFDVMVAVARYCMECIDAEGSVEPPNM